MSDALDVKEFLAGYLAEAEEHLAGSNRNLLAIEAAIRRGAHEPRAVRELFRSLHTLKGLSAMVGAEPIVDIAHEMEGIVRTADRAGGRLPAQAIDPLLRGVRAIEERVAQLSRGEKIRARPVALVEELATLQEAAPGRASSAPSFALEPDLLTKLSAGEVEELVQGVAAGRRAVRVDFHPSTERAAAGTTITRVRERMTALGDLVKVLPRAIPAADGQPGGVCFVLLVLTHADDAVVAAAAEAEPSAVSELAAAADRSDLLPVPVDALDPGAESIDVGRPNIVRVEVRRLDDALDRLAAMVVGRSRLQRAVEQLASTGRDVRDLSSLLREHGLQLRDLRSAIMRARMVRVSEVLERAPLIVRGLSKSSGKPIRLTVDAGDAELDKAVAERLLPVIVHLLRNAVDHAIESPAERARAGKPEEGELRISCVERAGSRLTLRLADDGRGIDRVRVARRAGVAVPSGDVELLELIVRPGLSTLDAATHTSGRGLGMEIIKRIVVDELHGSLALETTSGRGTIFTIDVPLSVTILDVFAFACGAETFAVPAGMVDELTEIDAAAVVTGPRLRGRFAARMLRLRHEELPLLALGPLLGMAPTAVDRPKAIVVKAADGAVAFEVDRMLGRQEIVVRPIIDPLTRVVGVAGTTDLGDGRPTLVLDLHALMPARRRTVEAA